MRVLDILYEMSADALADLKFQLAGKIKELPADDATIKTLREIEDLLRDANAGGRTGLLNKNLRSIGDPLVNEAHKLLARYINQILSFGNATPQDRDQLFSLWKENQLVDLDKLLSGDLVGFTEVFRGYNSNPIIQELVDELMVISALGHGKGEFALSVLSKSVNQPTSGKGDLIVKHNGKDIAVEVKTADKGKDKKVVDPKTGKTVVKKGKISSARFGDQEVIPGEGYEEASKDLNDFVRSKGKSVGDSGINVAAAIELKKTLSPKDADVFMGLIRNSVKIIFGKKFKNPRPDYNTKLMKNINGIISSIEKGDVPSTLQFWARANFNYYMAAKHDDGVLFINIPAGTCVYYNSAEDLESKGLRLNVDTTYLSGSDPTRTVYSQARVIPKDYGVDAITPEINKLYKNTSQAKTSAGIEKQTAKNKQGWFDTVSRLAARRNVKNQRTIARMADVAYQLYLNGATRETIIPELENQFPELTKNVTRSRAGEIPARNQLYDPFDASQFVTTDDEAEAS